MAPLLVVTTLLAATAARAARAQDSLHFGAATVIVAPLDSDRVSVQASDAHGSSAITLEADALSYWWPAANSRLTAAVQASRAARVRLKGAAPGSALALAFRAARSAASGRLVVRGSRRDSATIAVGGLGLLRIMQSLATVGAEAGQSFRRRVAGPALEPGPRCDAAMARVRASSGEPDQVQDYDSGSWHSESWWYWSKGVSLTFSWDDAEPPCHLSHYTFAPIAPPP